MDADRFQDDPWRRLPWVAPLALLVTVASQMAFLQLLQQAATTPPPAPISVQIVELPAPIRVPAEQPVQRPATLAPPPRRTPPPPRPKPEALPPAPAPPRPEPLPEPPSEPARQPAPAPPSEPSPPAPAVAAPSAPLTPGPAAPLESRPSQSPEAVARPQPNLQPQVTPSPPATRERQGRPDGVGEGGDKMGARAIYKPLPEIPEGLRHRDIDVVAVARFRVAANGSAQVELIEPTNDPDLNRALLDSLRRWRFFPGMEHGKPVSSTVDIRIPILVR